MIPSHASLRGTITSPADNKATQVTAVEVATGIRRTATIAADGTYNFASLRAGTYRLEIQLTNGTRNSAAPAIRERGDPEVLCYEIAKAVES